jgi:hypothetical protein
MNAPFRPSSGGPRRVPQMWSGIPEDMLAPEATLPSQFFDIWHHSRSTSPERLLALAVVEQALLDLQKYRFARRRRHQRLYMDAYRWVASDDREWLFSFANLCDGLGLVPDLVRRQLLGDVAPARWPASDAGVEEIEEAA